jgi:hypothetical protein
MTRLSEKIGMRTLPHLLFPNYADPTANPLHQGVAEDLYPDEFWARDHRGRSRRESPLMATKVGDSGRNRLSIDRAGA